MSLLRFAFEMKYPIYRTSRLFCYENKTAGKKFIRTSVVLHSIWRDYLNNFTQAYERIFEARFPAAFKIYRLFIVGSKSFFRETKDYLRIRREVNTGKNVRTLSRKEIEIYYEIPKDLGRVIPVIFVASLPLTNYFVFPLIYFFPRQLLSSHFWSMEQQVEFALLYHKKRILNNRAVFRHLQASLNSFQTAKLQDSCQKMFYKLGSGVHPTVEEIISAKEAFAVKPLRLSSLSAGHINDLCWMHGLSVLGLRKRKLINHAEMIRNLDVVLKREDVRKLSADDMRKACFLRGINPIGMKREDTIHYLDEWIKVTSHVNSENVSLLLHCPILLAYNQPTNWSLIH